MAEEKSKIGYCPMMGLRMHYNACEATKTKLTRPEHASPSGICAICTKDGICEIGLKGKTGRTLFPEPFGIAQFGAEKRTPNINDLQIMPELFGEGIFFTDVETEVEIGGFKCKSPVALAALGSTKVASSKADVLSEGAARAGIVRVIGENVFASFGKEGLKEMIDPYLKNQGKGYGAVIVQANPTDERLGVLKMGVELGAHGIELKMGQGAKQGLGGEIQFEGKNKAKKFKELGYMVLKHDEKKYERHVHPGDLTKEGLRKSLVKNSEFNVPIWIKIAMGRGIFEFLEECQRIVKEEKVPLKCVTVDGHGGGTGMSPWLIMNETSISSLALFKKQLKYDFDILLAGGFTSGIDVGKAMMLGADGASMGRGMIIAGATSGVNGVTNYVKAINEELQMLTTVLRRKKVNDIKGMRENLLALNEEAGKLFGIKAEL